ncbi:hypothetical protein [Brevibacillus borstelensis]|uniref:hypothetical protein n=1 Tax=Brevibacillus borstelensis TaxID=45462 RepID=UPI0030BBFC57
MEESKKQLFHVDTAAVNMIKDIRHTVQHVCQEHARQKVRIEALDGQVYEGEIVDWDNDHVYLEVEEEMDDDEAEDADWNGYEWDVEEVSYSSPYNPADPNMRPPHTAVSPFSTGGPNARPYPGASPYTAVSPFATGPNMRPFPGAGPYTAVSPFETGPHGRPYTTAVSPYAAGPNARPFPGPSPYTAVSPFETGPHGRPYTTAVSPYAAGPNARPYPGVSPYTAVSPYTTGPGMMPYPEVSPYTAVSPETFTRPFPYVQPPSYCIPCVPLVKPIDTERPTRVSPAETEEKPAQKVSPAEEVRPFPPYPPYPYPPFPPYPYRPISPAPPPPPPPPPCPPDVKPLDSSCVGPIHRRRCRKRVIPLTLFSLLSIVLI